MYKLKPLTDGFGRRITYLRISVTDRCNLRCVYCMPESGVYRLNHYNIICYEDILRLVDILSKHGVSKIRITGGEPLVRKGLTGFIKKISRIEMVRDISMTTNGTLFEKYAEELYNSGLKRINISLDSLKEERFRYITRGGTLRDVLSSIEIARQTGFNPVKINTVLIKGINDDEIIDFVDFAKKYELNLRFIEYMPIGGNIADAISSKEIEEKIKSKFSDFSPVCGERNNSDAGLAGKTSAYDGVSRLFGFKDGRSLIGFISPLSEHFCGDCNRLRLTASGNLRLCLFYDNEYNIKDILKEKDDDAVFEKISDIVRLKRLKHNFNEKAKKVEPSLCGNDANDFMNSIGG